jgi:hypothetical protein
MVRVGPPHFKRLVKNIRDSVYNTQAALNDIVDNVRSIYIDINVNFVNEKPNKYRISDDYTLGFENIELEDDRNPFNMGHICAEQSQDNYTSEYGMGLKNASIYICDLTTIYTRIINNDSFKYYKVVIDINQMCNEVNIIESYQPLIEEISYDIYKQYHIDTCGFESGSSIYLQNIRTFTDEIIGTPDEQLISLKSSLSKTYYHILQNETKIIKVNDVLLGIEPNIFELPICIERMVRTNIKVVINNNEITGIYYKQSYPGFEDSYKKLKIIPRGNIVNSTRREYDSITEFKRLRMKSTSTYTTPNNDDDILNYNTLQICRSSRNHGVLKFEKIVYKDGWMNHVANILHYSSKALNPFIGMTSAKIMVERTNHLTNVLIYILQQFQSAQHGIGLNKKIFIKIAQEQLAQEQLAQEQLAQEQLAEPVIEPTVEPVIEPVITLVVEPVITPVVEPVITPVITPVVEPVREDTPNHMIVISRTPVAATTRLTSLSPKNVFLIIKNIFPKILNSNLNDLIANASTTTQPMLSTHITNLEKFIECLKDLGLQINN